MTRYHSGGEEKIRPATAEGRGVDSVASVEEVASDVEARQVASEKMDRVLRRMANRSLAIRSRSSLAAYLVLVLVVLYFTGALRDRPGFFHPLLAFIGVLMGGRALWSLEFERIYDVHPRLWCRVFRIGALVSAGAWALAICQILPEVGFGAAGALILVGTTGLCAGAINSLAPCVQTLRGYLVITLLPVALLPVFSVGGELNGIGVMVVIYMVFLLIQGKLNHDAYWKNLCDHQLLKVRAEELDVARQAAEENSRVKSEFLANMSHEIRTPLNGVIGMTDLLLATRQTEEQDEFTRIAKASADSLLEVINDILDFSKIEAGKLQLDEVAFAPRKLLPMALAPHEIAARKKGLAFHCTFDESLPERIVGDPARLRQIVLNLVGNAIKFTSEGSVCFRMAASTIADEGRVHLEVTDTGIGIPEHKLTCVFESFRQADASMNRRFGGTGLGLTITTHLARLMGGEVSLESAEGHGSSFHVELPLIVAEENVPGLVNDGVEETKPTGESAPSWTVLVAEDNAVNRMLLTKMLERQGHRVVTCGNGSEAVATWEERRPDLILMDVQMPLMDGLEATAWIRAREGGRDRIPIIALTANALKGDRERCLEAGMDDYVTKPIDPEALTAAMTAAMTASELSGRR